MNAVLVPRKYRIEHDANEYAYFVEWLITDQGKKWAISFPGGRGDLYLTEKHSLEYLGHDTILCDTAEEAFERWKKYIECRGSGVGT